MPSEKMMSIAKTAESMFNSYHGQTLKTEKGVVKTFYEMLVAKFPSIEFKVLRKFARTRTFIRLRHLNRQSEIETLRKRQMKKIKQVAQ